MKNKYIELIVVFFTLGMVAFGGPAAHIGLMETEFVEKRKWISRETFLQMIGFTNIIPGPNSTEMASMIGYERAKRTGLVLAGISFILPAFLMVVVLSSLYQTFGSLSLLVAVLQGITPVIVAIIFLALLRLTKKVNATSFSWVLFVMVLLASLLTSINELWWLALGAVVYLGFHLRLKTTPMLEPFSLLLLFLTMLKIGSILYGGGYVLLAYFNADFVQRLGWINQQQLIDAVTIGQLTPGPIFTTATFIGFVLGDVSGAVLATIGIFAPSFVITMSLYPHLHKLKDHRLLQPLLTGVSIASVALMASVTWLLFQQSVLAVLNDTFIPMLLFLVSLAVLLLTQRSPLWLIALGALMGGLFLWMA
jgi:chromate transporter